MKAIVYTEYGSPDVLRLVEIEQPTPRDDEVLVSIHAASVNAGDWHCLRGKPFLIRLMNGLRRPKQKARILGDDMAGRVELVGKNVKLFHLNNSYAIVEVYENNSIVVTAYRKALSKEMKKGLPESSGNFQGKRRDHRTGRNRRKRYQGFIIPYQMYVQTFFINSAPKPAKTTQGYLLRTCR
jgi:threonine dehydrogenase-like Zn-dependent dehydrogenase